MIFQIVAPGHGSRNDRAPEPMLPVRSLIVALSLSLVSACAGGAPDVKVLGVLPASVRERGGTAAIPSGPDNGDQGDDAWQRENDRDCRPG